MDKAVVMNITDNVATCLSDLAAGDEVVVAVEDDRRSVTLKADIPFGHKVALTDIDAGDSVLKYAEIIGVASRPIAAGDHVHIHNVESVRARGDKK